MSAEDEIIFENSDVCWLCDEKFENYENCLDY